MNIRDIIEDLGFTYEGDLGNNEYYFKKDTQYDTESFEIHRGCGLVAYIVMKGYSVRTSYASIGFLTKQTRTNAKYLLKEMILGAQSDIEIQIPDLTK